MTSLPNETIESLRKHSDGMVLPTSFEDGQFARLWIAAANAVACGLPLNEVSHVLVS